jgi:hypothetical protein
MEPWCTSSLTSRASRSFPARAKASRGPGSAGSAGSADVPTGWRCPTCGHSYAPWVPECHHCPEPAATPILSMATGEPAAVNLRLPGDWAQPGYQCLIRAGGEWREAAPGLQILLGQPVADGEEAILHLRLTPVEAGP